MSMGIPVAPREQYSMKAERNLIRMYLTGEERWLKKLYNIIMVIIHCLGCN